MSDIVKRLRGDRPVTQFDAAGRLNTYDAVPSQLEREAADEIERLQKIIDSRPAINAGLPETYIQWSRSIYEMEAVRVLGLSN